MSFAYSDMPDQTGRTAVVTGANTGIGREIARALARKGARVVLACRDADRANEAIEDINSGPEQADLAYLHLDLANIASVRDAAEEAMREERIDAAATIHCSAINVTKAVAASARATPSEVSTEASVEPSATVTTRSKAFSLASVRLPETRRAAIRKA